MLIYFFIAGFFIKYDKLESPLQFIKGKIKSLFLPGTIIYLIAVLLHNSFVRIGWYPLGGVHPSSNIPYELWGVKEYIGKILLTMIGGVNGELAMGAMWFFYTLFFSLCGLSFICFITKVIRNRYNLKSIGIHGLNLTILTILAVISIVLTNYYGVTISRVSNSITMMLPIYLGYYLFNVHDVKFNNGWICCILMILYLHSVLLENVELSVPKNIYQDLFQLVLQGLTSLYVVLYISRLIEKFWLGGILCHIGKKSLYIMALHIIGLFIVNSLLECAGIKAVGDARGMYTYLCEGNIFIFSLYVIVGLGFPLLLVYIWDVLKKLALPPKVCHTKNANDNEIIE